jgi:hypothetical protein
LANRTTGLYLTRTFNVDPPEKRMMPGKPFYRTTNERLRMGIDCDEVYPGIIIGKIISFLGVSNPLRLLSSLALHVFRLFFSSPPPCHLG